MSQCSQAGVVWEAAWEPNGPTRLEVLLNITDLSQPCRHSLQGVYHMILHALVQHMVFKPQRCVIFKAAVRQLAFVAEMYRRILMVFHTPSCCTSLLTAEDLSCRSNNSVEGDFVPVLALFLPELSVCRSWQGLSIPPVMLITLLQDTVVPVSKIPRL